MRWLAGAARYLWAELREPNVAAGLLFWALLLVLICSAMVGVLPVEEPIERLLPPCLHGANPPCELVRRGPIGDG